MDADFAAAVAARLVPGGRAGAARRLTGGVSAEVHALEIESPAGGRRTVVVRRHRPTEGKAVSAGAARTEFELLRAVHGAGLPVPEPLLLDDSGRLVAEPFLVMAFVDGSIDIVDGEADTAIDTMAAALVRLHALPADDLPLLPIRIDALPELFEYLPEGAEWRTLRERLGRLEDTAYTGAPVLLHGDYWPGNLLWKDGRLAAILDWEDAALGDPLCDVACTRVELSYKFGTAGRERFTAAYGRAQPLDRERLALWDVFVSAAALKYMGFWGLDAALESQMRRTALDFLRAAGAVLTR